MLRTIRGQAHGNITVAALVIVSVSISAAAIFAFRERAYDLLGIQQECLVNMMSVDKLDATLPNGLHVVNEEGYSLVINTFQRPVMLYNILRHYLACNTNVLKEIRVIWNESPRKIPPWLHQFEIAGRVKIDRHKDGSLTNRFLPRNFSTFAVFSQDDDLFFSCELIETGFKIWRNHADRIVGFAPRFWDQNDPTFETVHSLYTWKTGLSNALLPTKGAFLHRQWYYRYSSSKYIELRKLVNQHITGEDFLMSMIHANVTGLPPIPLAVPSAHVSSYSVALCHGKEALTVYGDKGRANVVQHLGNVLGNPLVETDIFVDPFFTTSVPDTMCATCKSNNGKFLCKNSWNEKLYSRGW